MPKAYPEPAQNTGYQVLPKPSPTDLGLKQLTAPAVAQSIAFALKE
jgi:hypothetical protein